MNLLHPTFLPMLDTHLWISLNQREMEKLNEISLPLVLDGGGMNTSSGFVGEIILHNPFT